MNKSAWLAFITVFIVMQITNFLIHSVILAPSYMSSELQKLWRPDMMNKMWIMWLTGFIFSFFFTFIYTKGYEGKGIFEGIRYGLYIGLMMAIPMAYNQYAVYPILRFRSSTAAHQKKLSKSTKYKRCKPIL
ncbi:MAG: hypothetical protein KKF20_02470 [Bacteroidetes bacterium]|nr:hypothetical protein [Bacteroidota bacterium]MBU1423574.1 hypothetical protein [Bacteroidota bacterium]MBU2471255.1 hypothetical protein [Bacteroidota bacterium]MBU2635886.1 hypothetical protein [Bacteroidota bacterium]